MFVMDEMNNLEFFARLARLFAMDKTRFVLSFFGEVNSRFLCAVDSIVCDS